MKQKTISLREIEDGDLQEIMEWRTDPEITKYMFTDPKLDIESQRKWLSRISSDPSVKYRLIEIDGKSAGVISLNGLENPDGVVMWSYYIGNKKLRSIDVALSLEMSLYDYALISLGKNSVVADVLSLNKGVIKLHELCGCVLKEEKKRYIEKNGIWYDVSFQEMTVERWKNLRKYRNYQRIDFNDTLPKN